MTTRAKIIGRLLHEGHIDAEEAKMLLTEDAPTVETEPPVSIPSVWTVPEHDPLCQKNQPWLGVIPPPCTCGAGPSWGTITTTTNGTHPVTYTGGTSC